MQRLADLAGVVRITRSSAPRGAQGNSEASAARQRAVLADVCRALDPRNQTKRAPGLPCAREIQDLSPRQQQTLSRLLAGDSEKQIARRLDISRHTVHVYVKALYRQFKVSSRGELLAKFVSGVE
jgi:LuxR family maltose regulon positive regulatory protein